MADRIENWHTDLAEQVRARTAELSESNERLMAEVEQRRRAETVLRESEAKYRTLVEGIPQKVFAKDRNSVYVACNENYARDLGIRPEEIEGKTDYDFYPEELADKYRADDGTGESRGTRRGVRPGRSDQDCPHD